MWNKFLVYNHKGNIIQLRRGLEFLNWTNYLFHFLSAIIYLFPTWPQAKYLFRFLRKKNYVYKGLRRRAKRHECKRHLISPREARQIFLQWPLNMYLQHVLQTIIYVMKIHSRNIHLKNTCSAEIDFSRENLTSVDVRFWRLKSLPAL